MVRLLWADIEATVTTCYNHGMQKNVLECTMLNFEASGLQQQKSTLGGSPVSFEQKTAATVHTEDWKYAARSDSMNFCCSSQMSGSETTRQHRSMLASLASGCWWFNSAGDIVSAPFGSISSSIVKTPRPTWVVLLTFTTTVYPFCSSGGATGVEPVIY